MAITFNNVIYDQVIDSFNTLIANEFNIPVYFDKNQGNQSFLITPVSDEFEELLNIAEVRNYSVNIRYEVNSAGTYTKLSIRQVSNIAERMKRLIYNNKNYIVSGTRKFNNATVANIEYGRNEDDNDIIFALMNVSVSTMEVIS